MCLRGKAPGGSQELLSQLQLLHGQPSKLVESLPSLGCHLLFWISRMKDGSGIFVSGAPAASPAGSPARGPERVTHPSLAKSGRGWAGGGEGKRSLGAFTT